MQDVLLITLLRALYPDLTDVAFRLIEPRINLAPNVWFEIPLPKGNVPPKPLLSNQQAAPFILLRVICGTVDKHTGVHFRLQVEFANSRLGRSLRSCQTAFEEMRRSIFQTSLPPPLSYNVTTPFYSAPSAGAGIPRKRSWEEGAQTISHRELLPRPPRSTDSPIPPVTNGEPLTVTRALAPDSRGEPPKKRGRPNKEAVQLREKEYAAKGEVYRPKPRKSRKPERLAGSPLPPVTSVSKALYGSSGDTPPSATVEKQDPDPDEKDSSGRQNGKQPRDEHMGTTQVSDVPQYPTVEEELRVEEPISTGSPSDRLLARSNERDFAERAGRRTSEFE